LKQSVNVFHSLILYRRLPAARHHQLAPTPARRKEKTRTFIVKPIYPVDASALVVPAEDKKVLRVLDFVRKQQANRLERLFPAIDVVAEEEVVRFGREAPVLEQP
jgi:hypothetical protein